MSIDNPFLFIYSSPPYRPNPFTIVGVPSDVSQATIEALANAREQMITAGLQPEPRLKLQQGDFITAAQQLQYPVLRLAFDLMLNWPEPVDE